MLKKIKTWWNKESNMQIAAREMKESRMELEKLLVFLVERDNKRIKEKEEKLNKEKVNGKS